MSLYNMLNKVSPIAPSVIGALGMDYRTIPRFRDAFVRDDGPDGLRFVILTRTGGNNRADYHDEIDAMHCHPDFIRDTDDPYDSTYAFLEFRISDEATKKEIQEGLEEIRTKMPDNLWLVLRNFGMEEITNRNIEAIKRMPVPPRD